MSKKRKYRENVGSYILLAVLIDTNSDESRPEKKIQSVSNNEIVEDAILITDGMVTERKEETVYNPIEKELWVLLCFLSNEHAIFHLILYFFFLKDSK